MKFFVFLVVVVSAWYAMTWLQQTGAALRRGGQQRSTKAMRAMDTVACQRCGTYVSAEFPTACDRRDCPFPGVG